MRTWTSLLIAAPVAVGLLTAPAAHAEWRGHGGWGGHGWHHGRGVGPVGGALLGLGIGALVGGAVVASQPQYYAPPPVAYAPPPAYYPAPAYTAGPSYYPYY